MANEKKKNAQGVNPDMQPVLDLIAAGKRDGSVTVAELAAVLEHLDLTPEQIEQIYGQFDAMGIQIVSEELDLEIEEDDEPTDVPENVEEEVLVEESSEVEVSVLSLVKSLGLRRSQEDRPKEIMADKANQ